MEKKKLIWIVNYHTSSPELATNPRYLEFAHYFQKVGYDVITFNSSVKHEMDIDLIPDGSKFYEKQYGEYRFIHVKSPHYKGNGIKRMWSLFVFAWRMFIHCKKLPRPDIVLHNVHTPFDYPISWCAKRVHAKYVVEAWDLWPRAFENYGLVKKGSMVMKVAYAIEKHLYKKADDIIFTMEGGIDYLRDHKWTSDLGGPITLEKIHYINNGINLENFSLNCKAHPRFDFDLNNPDIYKIVYMGSVQMINHVKELIDAVALLKDFAKYRLFIYGDGSDRQFLEEYVKENHISNVIFKEKRIPYEDCAWVVSQSKVNVINYENGFGHYGASSGKLFLYLAAGKPICCNIKLNYSLISKYNLGVEGCLDTPEQYANAIRFLAEQSEEEYEAMCQRVRSCAQQFDYKNLATKELEILERSN